jgi:hypothetical protein
MASSALKKVSGKPSVLRSQSGDEAGNAAHRLPELVPSVQEHVDVPDGKPVLLSGQVRAEFSKEPYMAVFSMARSPQEAEPIKRPMV